MALTKINIQSLYRERAGNYDLSANLYYLIGFREARYRKLAISKLGFEEGSTAVELGCGTGLNFGYVLDHIGETGNLIGIDLTNAMLVKAKDRIEKNNWKNVELVNVDAANYNFPENINGVYSSFALTLIPEYEEIISKVARALSTGGRFVLLDLKHLVTGHFGL